MWNSATVLKTVDSCGLLSFSLVSQVRCDCFYLLFTVNPFLSFGGYLIDLKFLITVVIYMPMYIYDYIYAYVPCSFIFPHSCTGVEY